MPTVVELPNGEELEFPDGVDEGTQLRETRKYVDRQAMAANDRAGARAETVAKAADAVSQAIDPRPPLQALGKGIGLAGRGWTAVAEDAIDAARKLPGNLLAGRGPFENGVDPKFLDSPARIADGEFGGNFAAAAEGRPGANELQEEAASKAGDLASTVKLGVRDAVRNLPAVAAGAALVGAGVPAPVAFGGVLGAQAYGETGDATKAVQAAGTGMFVPLAGAAGKAAAGSVLKGLVARGWLGAENELAQKGVEMVASQAGMQTMMEASRAPEYLQASPEERKRMLARSVAGNLAFMLADAPALASGEPSATQEGLANDAMALVNAALRRAPLDRMSPDELAREAMNPEHGMLWADAARDLNGVAPKDDNVVQVLGDTKIVKKLTPIVEDQPEAANEGKVIGAGSRTNVENFYVEKAAPERTNERPADLADELAGGGHGKLRKLKPGETVDNEEAYRKAQRDFPELFAENGRGLDEVADSVTREKGKLVEPGDLIDELSVLKEKRTGDREQVRKQTAEWDQDAAFQKDVIEGGRRAKVEDVPVIEVGEGDTVRANGEAGIVTNVRMRPGDETMVESVTIKFGPKYGTKIVPADATLKVDPGTWKRANPEKVPAGVDVAFNIEQKLLPRTIEGDTAAAGSEPVSLGEIRQYLSQALDIPVRARRYGQRALGIFKAKPETIRLRAINDISTLAHEVGHYLHKIVLGGFGNNFAKQFDPELMALGKWTSKASYTPAMVRNEGVAEFVREWMTDRSQALAKAPLFLQHFEGTLQSGFPEVWKIVTQARKDLGRYIRQPAMMKLESRIDRSTSKGKVSAGMRVREFMDHVVDDWVNELAPVERAMAEAVRFGLGAQDAKLVTDLATNFIGGWRGKVEYALRQRQIDLAGNDVGPSLHEVLGPVEDLEEFGRYLVGRRELELLGRGIKTGMDVRDAHELRVELGKLDGKYGAARDGLYRFQEQQLKLLVDSGLLNAKQFMAIRKENQAYVPFFRVMEFLGGQGGGGRTGTGFINMGQGIMRLKGSDRRYVEPLESVVKNAYMLRELAERNKVGRAFVDAIGKIDGGGRIAERIATRLKPMEVRGEEVANVLMKQLGIMVPPGAQQDLAFTIWRAAQQRDPNRGIFTVWKEGKEEVWQLGDPDLYRALALKDSADAEMLSRFPLARAGSGFTRVLRAGATLTLEFMARNPFRDQITAGVYSRYGFVPFFDGFRGMLSALGKDHWYWDWVKSGGRYADFVAIDRGDLQKKLGDVANDPSALQMVRDFANPLKVIENLQKLSELVEQATRIGEYRRAMEAGASELQAANASKEVSLNFARAGFKGKALNMLVAFFNAKMQDLSKFKREHQERPLATTAKALALITLPSLLCWYLGKDDKEMERLPWFRKRFFWNVNVKDLARRAGIDTEGDFILSFPKPFLLGQVYGSSVEAGLDYAHGRDPNAVKKWFAGILQETPLTWDAVIPTAMRPAMETAANQNFYRNAPIENQGMQALPPELRYGPGTSLVSRKLSEMTPWLGLSPLKIDNLMRGYLGGLGKYGTDAVDWIMTRAEIMDVPPAVEKGIWERPLFRAFARSPYEASEFVERFYKGMELAEQRIAGVRSLVKNGDPDAARNFAQRVGKDVGFYLQRVGDKTVITELRNEREHLGEIVRAMHNVQNSRTMTPADKREKLTELGRLRDRMAEGLFKSLISPTDQAKVY